MKRKTFYSVLIMHFVLQTNLSFGQSGYCNLSDWTALKALYESTNGDDWTINSGWDLIKTEQPPEDCNLESMYGITLGGDCFVDDEGLTDCFFPLGVFDIFLNGNNLNGTIPPEIGNMAFLKHLGLEINSLSGSLPKEIAQLNNLQYLSTSNNELNGCYNDELEKICTQLLDNDNYRFISEGNNFDASWEDFCTSGKGSCSLPSVNCRKTDSLALISVLSSLGGFIDWEYPIDYWPNVALNENGCVDAIKIFGYNYGGSIHPNYGSSIHPAIGDFSEITEIVVIENGLSGVIPIEIGNLTTLEYLDLSGNQITEIPASIGKLINLKTLNLGYFNNIETIPTTIGDLVNLEHLEISSNPIAEIPASIGNLQNLQYLDVSATLIESLPETIGNLSKLTTLWLSYNKLSKLPASLGNLNQLSTLLINDGQLTGQLPTWLVNMEALKELQTFNNQLGTCYDVALEPLCNQLSPSFNNNASISNGNNFDSSWEAFCFNREGACNVQPLTCRQTDSIALLKIYQSLKPDNTWDFSQTIDKWRGVTLNENGCIDQLDLYEDGLNGSIPAAIGDLSEIRFLYLTENKIIGTIPNEIGNLTKLKVLELHENQLEGAIPASFKNLTNLEALILSNNKFTELSNITNFDKLTELWLANNEFSGCFPAAFKQLCDQLSPSSNTNYTISDGNNFDATWEDFCKSGIESCLSTPVSCKQLDSLALMAVYQSLNVDYLVDFSQPMDSWYGVTLNENGCVDELNLYFFYLGGGIEGSIPAEIGYLSQLTSLDMSYGNITGSIPSEIGNLSKLQHLSLNANSLEGPIPATIGNLTNLRWLNLGHNNLTEIPESIGNLSGLRSLFLGSNKIAQLPKTIYKLDSIFHLALNGNKLSGLLPVEFSEMEQLSDFHINNNQLSGCYADELKQLCTQLLFGSSISNGNNFDTTWKDFCATGAGICTPSLSSCRQTDSLALIEIYKSLNAEYLLENALEFQDPLDAWPGVTLNEKGCIESLYLSEYWFDGTISSEIGNLSELTGIWLDRNYITGPIPAEIANLSKLETLYLSQNNLSGCFADELKQLCDQLSFVVIDNDYNVDATWADFCATEAGSCRPLENCRQTDSLALVEIYKSLNAEFLVDFSEPISSWSSISLNENGCVNSIDLSELDVSGTIPPEIGELSEIEYILLQENEIAGTIPREISKLTKLKELNLSSNNFEGAVPTTIGNLTNLEHLYLNGNEITEIPFAIGNLSKLLILDASNNQLTELPAAIVDLLQLSSLNFASNNISYIPETISRLTNLQFFRMDNNNLLELPASIRLLDNLHTLFVNDNEITGSLPAWLAEMDQLDNLNIQNNQLSGCYADELKQLCNQFTPFYNVNKYISDGNNFDVNWEDFCASNAGVCSTAKCHIDDWTALKALYENTNGDNWTNREGWDVMIANQSSPPVDCDLSQLYGVQLYNSDRVTSISLSANNLQGNIPSEIGMLSKLNSLSLYGINNNISGAIPPEIGQLINLENLDISNNQLTGTIPPEIGALQQISVLNLSNNNLSGNIPAEIGQLTNLFSLMLQDNQLTGSIPSSLGNLIYIYHIYLYNNQLSGCYDDYLINICHTSLNWTTSDGNNFDANWEDFCDTGAGSCNLQPPSCRQTDSLALIEIYKSLNADFLVDFSQPIDNWFGVKLNENGCVDEFELFNLGLDNAAIPPEIGDLSEITVISLFGNSISGTIPEEIGNLTNLKYLSLVNNKLEGVIPNSIGNLSQLITLDVGFNNISYIPETINKLNNLEVLLLDSNNLVELPASIGSLNFLNTLWINDNEITGPLPTWLTKIEQLSNLQIQNNQLSGCYQEELKQLCVSLEIFNVSEGNNFDSTWEDFCASGNGTCSTPNCNIDDWTALKAIYESTNGDNWTNRSGWDVMIDNQNSPPANCDLSLLEGIYLDEEKRVSYVLLWYNNLQGEIPPEINKLSSLEGLWLSGPNNYITGSIPREIGMLSNLKYLILDNNELTGFIPTEIGKLNNLVSLVLSNNNLNGQIPYQISFLSNLEDLFLDGNQLSDEIPAELSKLDKLYNLVLVNNQLSGCFTDELKQLCGQISPDFNLFIPRPPIDAIAYGNDFDISWEEFCSGIECIDFRNFPDQNYQNNQSYNYPNPFTEQTNINFVLNTKNEVSISIYNSAGSVIKILYDSEMFDAGEHTVVFKSENLPPGIYYYNIRSKSMNFLKKIVCVN